MTINDIPKDILTTLNALPWADNGILWGIRYEKDKMWNHSHIIPTSMVQHQGVLRQEGGNYILKHDGAGIDPVPEKLPGIGQPVLQVHRAKGIVRTSRVKRVVVNSAFPIFELEPYGPAAGEPIPGDSGSIFFARDENLKPAVLGMAIHQGWLSFARPGTTQQYAALSESESLDEMNAILGSKREAIIVNTAPATSSNDDRQHLLDKIKDLEAINARQAALILRLRETFSELLKP